ncbi:glutathione S-transferase family protein [Variovorax dokdonensis]|uniref:Glutathione S-transferase family protein n=1 Tax=Variovorax dokdonensis TaxID=344883 RepID=A0ABT7N5M2_9BURK|nr:glutathione S-transferase family protein [Variovorax dokdonensis]MDM0043221.1 glutathione S-transferase family protein [Variovorax dokdonensis]
MLKLYIGNKNYSSWSMRVGVLMTQAGIEHEEIWVPFDAFTQGSAFKSKMATLSPTALVPLLVDGDLHVWDSLSIAEYLAERFPDLQLWPADTAMRAVARSVCAEMHGGFRALRNHCAMNIEADLATQGAIIWRDQAEVRSDVDRIVAMWSELLAKHAASHADGMLFGRFSIADAYFAPVVMRLARYALPVSADIQAYLERVQALPGVKAWIDGAMAEKQFVAFDEPYRMSR